MFVAFDASLNDFILGCRKLLFINETHLSGLYEGAMPITIVMDVNNHIFDVAYVVMGETNDDWLQFLIVLHKCLVG